MTIRVSLKQTGYFICLYVRRRRANLWSSLDTVLFLSLPSGRSISKGTEERREVTRFRSGEKIKEETNWEWERREALFCLGEETRPERRARKLSVCLPETHALLTPRVLRPATLSYIFVVRAPFFFAPAFTKYEGRFARVLRVKTRYRIGGASATAVTSLLYRFRISFLPPCLGDVVEDCREKGCIWHAPKVPLLAPVREIFVTWRSSVNRTVKYNLREKSTTALKIIKIKLLICHKEFINH